MEKISKWVCVSIGVLFLLLSLFYAYLFGAVATQQGVAGNAFSYLGVSIIFAILGLYPTYKALPSRWK